MFFYACEESSNYAPKISEQDIALNLVAEKKNGYCLQVLTPNVFRGQEIISYGADPMTREHPGLTINVAAKP